MFSQCVAKADDSTLCECRQQCSALQEAYFCGTDGRSYQYPCGDRAKKCSSIPGVGWRHSGECGEKSFQFVFVFHFVITSAAVILALVLPLCSSTSTNN